VPTTFGCFIWIKTLSSSSSRSVLPSGWIGVFSSVNAATISISSEILPESCNLNPLLNEKSFVVPTVNPRTIVPLFCISEPKIASGDNPVDVVVRTLIVSPNFSSYLITKLLLLYSFLSESLNDL